MPSVELGRFRRETTTNSQRCNEAFTAFLKNLRFPNDDDMYELFACAHCETILPNSEKIPDEIVMDGTTVDILDTFPPFESDKRLVLYLQFRTNNIL